MIEIKCDACGVFKTRRKAEVNRSLKLRRKFYCSLSCKATHASNSKGNTNNLKADNLKDEFSPFRFFLKKVKERHNKKDFEKTDLTLEFLKELWDKQNGICPISGWKMELPKTTTKWGKVTSSPKRASLDRIEPRKPYTKDNVRYVCFIANMCKSTFDDGIVVEFAKAVVENND